MASLFKAVSKSFQAIIIFILALLMDFFVITALPSIITLIADADTTTYYIAEAGVIILLITINLVGPLLPFILDTEPE